MASHQRIRQLESIIRQAGLEGMIPPPSTTMGGIAAGVAGGGGGEMDVGGMDEGGSSGTGMAGFGGGGEDDDEIVRMGTLSLTEQGRERFLGLYVYRHPE